MLETRSLFVRMPSEDDLETLFEWRNDPVYRRYCSERKHCVTYDEFLAELPADRDGGVFVKLIATRKRDGKPVGTIWAYKLDTTHGHVATSIYLAPSFRKRGYGAELMVAMLYYLFDSMPWLYKVYSEVFADNEYSLKTMLNAGFEQEARFKGHDLINNERIDHLWLALYKSLWDADPDNLVKRLLPGYAHTLRNPV